jgi:hypothetical protein
MNDQLLTPQESSATNLALLNAELFSHEAATMNSGRLPLKLFAHSSSEGRLSSKRNLNTFSMPNFRTALP